MTDRARTLLTVGLAVAPSVIVLAMNTFAWDSDLDAIAMAYRFVICVGLLMAAASIWMAIGQMRRGGPYTVSGISLLIAIGFIVWVGPDAYLDLAAALAGP